MLNWTLRITDKYERKHKHYEKKNPEILSALANNLNCYHDSLKKNILPQNITAGFIHSKYPHGIKSIDQSGGERKLKEARLYIYPDTDEEVLYLLTIGDKKSQPGDVKICNAYVKDLNKKKKGKEKVGDK